MPAPKKDVSIRDDTARIDLHIPNPLIERVETIAAFLGLTRRAAILVILHEGCLNYERMRNNVEQARENAIAE